MRDAAKLVPCPHCGRSAVRAMEDVYEEMDEHAGRILCSGCMRLFDPHAERTKQEEAEITRRHVDDEGEAEAIIT